MGELPGQSYRGRADWAHRVLKRHRETLIDDEVIDAIDVLLDAARADVRALLESHARLINELCSTEDAYARVQGAVDRAQGALTSSAYVGGPSEREAWQTATLALGEVATQHQGANPDV